jgi:hypothetical protein
MTGYVLIASWHSQHLRLLSLGNDRLAERAHEGMPQLHGLQS